MSSLEERLRDAFGGAAGTVAPGTIRGLDEPVTRRSRRDARRSRRRSRRSRLGRGLAPLAAAAAVAAIIVLVAVVLRPTPRSPGQAVPAGASAAEPKFLIAQSGGSLLQVRNAATGALAAEVGLPDPNQPNGGPTGVTSVATADGRTYLVAIAGNPCRSWLYQFRLNGQGQPGAVTPFAALRTVRSALYDLTFSGNGQLIAYTTTNCMGATPRPSYVATTNIRTGQTRRWTVPGGGLVDSVSLTADGGQLCYSLQGGPSVVRIIPTSAAAGSAADRGRTVVRAAQFGGSEWISFAVISRDGKAVYFTTYSSPQTGQVRVLDLATGRSRVLYAPAGQPGVISADLSVRHLLLHTSARKLVSLDLATGHITYLPGSQDFAGAIITW